jgi:LmbE family N-acetylglucosaminyl deacetylase
MQRLPPPPRAALVPDSGRVLVFAAHPGDELVGLGGTLALHAEQEDPVHVIVAFDGRTRDPRGLHAGAELAERRRAEALAGGARIGLTDFEFWDYPEGREPTPDELFFAARLFAERIRELQPRTLYAPWIGEGEQDQRTLARAALLALEMAERELAAWGYELCTPLAAARVIDITPVWERKRAAIEAHSSRLIHGDLAHRTLGLNAQRSTWLGPGARYGEAFSPLRPAASGIKTRGGRAA